MEYDVREADRDGRSKLVRINDDGTEDDLGWDGGEPEDNLFYRSWSWVPEELNRLAGLLSRADAHIELLSKIAECALRVNPAPESQFPI